MRKIISILMILMIAMAMPSASASSVDDIVDTVVDSNVMGNATQYAYSNNIVELSNGTLVVGYIDNVSEPVVTTKYSTDGGSTWSNPIYVDDSLGGKFDLCMATNESSDYVHYVWAKDNGTTINVYHAYLSPITWLVSSNDTIASDVGRQDQPYIAFVDDGTTSGYYCVWRQEAGPVFVIYFSYMEGDTGEWAEMQVLDSLGAENQFWPCLAQNKTGVMHVTFSEWNGSDSTWDLMHSYTDEGWTNPTQLNASHYNQTEAKVISSPSTIPDTDFMFYAWTEENASTYEVKVSLVRSTDDDAGNLTLATNGTNVSCTMNHSSIRVLWINTSATTSGEIYTFSINESLVVTQTGRITNDDYTYRWPSCFWYNGTNSTDYFLVTRGTSTDVVFFDFEGSEDGVTEGDYAWIDNLIELMITITGVILIMIILTGMFKPFNRLGR